jgi:hypothetical protein
MSQPLRVAAFELIISGRFWVIAKDEVKLYFANNVIHLPSEY